MEKRYHRHNLLAEVRHVTGSGRGLERSYEDHKNCLLLFLDAVSQQKQYQLIAVGSFRKQIMHLATVQKMFRIDLRNMTFNRCGVNALMEPLLPSVPLKLF